MNERKMVNLHPATAKMLQIKLDRINKARAKENMKPLKQGEIIEMALIHLTVEIGISR